MKLLRRACHVVSIVTFLLNCPACAVAQSRPQNAPKTDDKANNDQNVRRDAALQTIASQLSAIREQAARTEEQRAQRDSQPGPPIYSNWVLIAVTAGAVIAAFRTLGKLERQVVSNKESADAAKVTAEIAKDSMALLQRPFIHADTYRLRWSRATDTSPWMYFIAPALKNTGPIHTKDMTLVTNAAMFNSRLPKGYAFAYRVPEGPTFIGPGMTREGIAGHLSQFELADVQAGRRFFYMWGEAKYFDLFPKTPIRTTHFCIEVRDVLGDPADPASVKLTFYVHPEYNDAD